MEDSRNIIKAIDALTLKAGGEAVDSKNITEAIDHLKEVYSQEAIGIDDTLTQEGLAADAKAVGDAIDSANSAINALDERIDLNSKIIVNSNYVNYIYARQCGHYIMISMVLKSGIASGETILTFFDEIDVAYLDYTAPIFFSNGSVASYGSIWIEKSDRKKIKYYGTQNLSETGYCTLICMR